MRKVVLLSVFVFAVITLFAQGASKYLVYKETTKTGHTSFIHVLAGENYAVTSYDCKPKASDTTLPFLDCNIVCRKPAGYKLIHVVDRYDGIYVADVPHLKYTEINREKIIERMKPDPWLLAVMNEILTKEYPDSVYVDEPVIMKFTPNIGSERLGDFDCTIGEMQITESWNCKIWYTKMMDYNWVQTRGEFWLVPGTVVRAEYSDGLVYSLDNVSDMDIEVGDNTESVKAALSLFFGR